MYKKVIKFTDYNGIDREEEFLFNLNKAELMEMHLSESGGMEEYLKKIIATQDSKQLVSIFKEIILKSIGDKSVDGKRFIKNDEIRDAFVQSEAYSELFMELATNADAAAEFVNGIMPKNLDKNDNKPAIAPVN